jgi:hypothetical protein
MRELPSPPAAVPRGPSPRWARRASGIAAGNPLPAVQAECQQCGVSLMGLKSRKPSPLSRRTRPPTRNTPPPSTIAPPDALPYRFAFRPRRCLDWAPSDRAARLEDGRRRIRGRGSARQRTALALRRRRVLTWVAAAGGVAALWSFRHWWRTGALPGMEPVPRYQVDPRSLPPDPNQARP